MRCGWWQLALAAGAGWGFVSCFSGCVPPEGGPIALVDASDARLPDGYSDGALTVITSDGAGAPQVATAHLDPTDRTSCVDLGATCWVPSWRGPRCERPGGPMDAVVVDGAVKATVCYPPDPWGRARLLDVNRFGDVVVPDGQSDTTLVMDESTAGVPIEGDVVLDGDHVALFGLGAGLSRITGTLTLSGRDVRVRGFAVDGDVIISGNNAALVDVTVKGDIAIDGNKAVLASVRAGGRVTSSMSRPVVVGVTGAE